MMIEFIVDKCDIKIKNFAADVRIIGNGDCVVIDGLLNSYQLEQILTKMKELQGENNG